MSARNTNQNTSFSTVLNSQFRVCPQTENSNSSQVFLSAETQTIWILVSQQFVSQIIIDKYMNYNSFQISPPKVKIQMRKTSFSARNIVNFQEFSVRQFFIVAIAPNAACFWNLGINEDDFIPRWKLNWGE